MADKKKPIIIDSDRVKLCIGDGYNYLFKKDNGHFARWGKTRDDDPDVAPAPEILDIEVTTECEGPGGTPCSFCYKSNSPKGKSMDLPTFRSILDTFPPNLTQVAFGVNADASKPDDLPEMFKYCREKGIVPNVTVADLVTNKEHGKFMSSVISELCGAVAVSRYENKDICYDTIQLLLDQGMEQVNMHFMLSQETRNQLYHTFGDINRDARLKGLNAIVILSLKQKGRGTGHKPVCQDSFTSMVRTAFASDIPLGFDSCSAPKYLTALDKIPNSKKEQQKVFIEPCESGCFSSYINVEGEFYPCSFAEQVEGWETGIPIYPATDFVEDVWEHPRTVEFRTTLLANNRNCPLYNL